MVKQLIGMKVLCDSELSKIKCFVHVIRHLIYFDSIIDFKFSNQTYRRTNISLMIKQNLNTKNYTKSKWMYSTETTPKKMKLNKN